MNDHRQAYSNPSSQIENSSSTSRISYKPDEIYFTLVENAPDIIFLVDLKGNFIYLNTTVQKITGYPLASLQKKNLKDIVAPEYYNSIKNIFDSPSQTSHIPLFEIEIISSNGNRIPLDIHFKPLRNQKGQIYLLLGIARDFTERKKIETALKESKKKYSTLVEQAKDGVIIIHNGICKFANKAVEEISGYSPSELIGRSIFDKLPPGEREKATLRYRQHLQDKESISFFTTRINCKNGTQKEVEISISSIPYEGHSADMGIIRDVSECNKMNKALRQSEENYRLLVENIDDLIFILDSQMRFVYASPAIEKYKDQKASDIKGMPFIDLVCPEDKEKVKLALKKIDQESLNTWECRFLNKEGKPCYVQISTRLITDNNSPGTILGIATDISQRKLSIEKLNQAYKEVQQTKAKLKAIIDNAPNIAIQGFNKKGEVIFWNPSSKALFGFSEEEMKGKTIDGLFLSESEQKGFSSLLKDIFLQKKPSSLMEWTTTTKRGEEKHILSSFFPIFLSGQEPIAVAMNVDITERKKAEEKIKEMTRQIEMFSEISADILSIEDEEELFDRIAQAVVDISDFNRVLISYFIEESPYREIIGHKGVKEEDLERVKKVKMPPEKYQKYFEKGIKLGNQSCYIPHELKNILDKKAMIPGEKNYPEQEGRWHREDNLLVSMKDTKGNLIGIISVDDSKSGLIPTKETVRPLEVFANMISEIIQRRKLTKKIRISEKKYRELISNIKVGVFRMTPTGELLEINPSALELLGYDQGEKFLNLRIEDLYHNPDDNEKFMKEIDKQGIVKNKEFLLKKRDGTFFWASITSTAVEDANGKTMYYDTVIEDITERKKLEEEVKRLSVTDELTGLYNRRYFNEHLPIEIKTAERWRSTLSLIMIDIDDFKPYNDSYHHLKGDEVIREAAEVISANIRKETDWASRFGGDEFAIILPGTEAAEALTIAERIRRAFQAIEFRPERASIQKTISLGVAYCHYREVRSNKQSLEYKADYEKIATELTNLADKALFNAKKSGKNKIFVSKQSIELSRMPFFPTP